MKTIREIDAKRKSLPIYKGKQKILETINNSKVTIIAGSTGSGKTTQIPQYLLEQASNLGKKIKIAVTQPRRVSAISLCERVCLENNSEIGNLIGYKVRFEEKLQKQTSLVFITDGMLVRDLIFNKTKYDYIIVDEAHERSIQTDLCLGILKKLECKLIVMSATLNIKKYRDYYIEFDPKIVIVEGRMYNVEIMYLKRPTNDYFSAAILTVLQISKTTEKGDILLFLTGQEEIERTVENINSMGNKDTRHNLIAYPLYSALSLELQKISINPSANNKNIRRVIVSTNIAETSLTISNIKFVIDCGYNKVKTYKPSLGMNTLFNERISKSSAKQRSGRAGREDKGICYRLYTEKEFLKMEEEKASEIIRSRLDATILSIMRFGIDNVMEFDFIDKPPNSQVEKALETLHSLEAIDDDGRITQSGISMSKFPLSPSYSKMILNSIEKSCLESIVKIISLLCIEDFFYRTDEDQETLDSALIDPKSDHCTLLNIFDRFTSLESNDQRYFCSKYKLNIAKLRTAVRIKKQLMDISKNSLKITDNHINVEHSKNNKDKDMILSCIFEATPDSRAIHLYDNVYQTNSRKKVHVHPSSFVDCRKKHAALLFDQLIYTSNIFIRYVSVIPSQWAKNSN